MQSEQSILGLERFVFYNPHGYWYKTTEYRHFHKSLDNNKYEYIFDYFYNKGKVYVYIDDHDVSIGLKSRKKFWRWVFLNGLNPFKFEMINSLDNLNKHDVLFGFQYAHFNYFIHLTDRPSKLIDSLLKCSALKILHLSHYSYAVQQGSEFSKESCIDLFVYENNLSKNCTFFQHHYPWYKKDVYVLPFVAKSRFKRLKTFSDRKNLACASGSIARAPEGLEDFFGTTALHPMRVEIYSNKESVVDIIQCNIMPYIDDAAVSKNIVAASSMRVVRKKYARKTRRRILFLLKSFCSYLKINMFRPPKSSNVTYDIVDFFNDHRACIVPEEIIGAPAISFVESMACGCAFVGINDRMYTDIGMKDGLNYIGYDGTFDNLCDKLKYYLQHYEELENIAEAGYDFAHNELSATKIMDGFVMYCNEIIKGR